MTRHRESKDVNTCPPAAGPLRLPVVSVGSLVGRNIPDSLEFSTLC